MKRWSTGEAPCQDTAAAPYRSNLDHLTDLLACLEDRIRWLLLAQRSQNPAPDNGPFRGLVITGEEVDSLLACRLSDERCASPGVDAIEHYEQCRRREEATRLRAEQSERRGLSLALPRLACALGLDAFEQQCVVACFAVEMDRRYEKLFAYLQDDVSQRNPTIDLVLKLACETAEQRCAMRSAFEPQAKLLKYQLVHIFDRDPCQANSSLARSLKLDERIVRFLLEPSGVDSRVASLRPRTGTRVHSAQATVGRQLRQRLCTLGTSRQEIADGQTVFVFRGPTGCGQLAVVEEVCRAVGRPVIMVDSQFLADEGQQSHQWVILEAKLQRAALCLTGAEILFDEGEARRSIQEALLDATDLVFLLCDGAAPRLLGKLAGVFEVEFPMPTAEARHRLWRQVLAGRRWPELADLEGIAGVFRFTPSQIMDAAMLAENYSLMHSADGPADPMADLRRACRKVAHGQFGHFARRIKPACSLRDLVLPAEQMEQLREIVHRVAHQSAVAAQWQRGSGDSSVRGLPVVFAGPPGTGKTLAAEALARETGLELYKIDLAQIVSKYIGETEKNLQQVFDAADHGNTMLFFDEADALFGKRTEIKDAHDRYANMETAYLLQQIECFRGVSILATNVRQNIDPAFLRRCQVVVDFPFPDGHQRRMLWDAVLPPAVSRSADVDWAHWAQHIQLSGGNIRNIALAACFYANADATPLRDLHIERAAKREYQKLGQVWNGRGKQNGCA